MWLRKLWKLVCVVLIASVILWTPYSIEASDDILAQRPNRPSIISQKNLIDARDGVAIGRLEPHQIYSNENANLNSVGLSGSVGVSDADGRSKDVGRILKGPNVCTKQEP